MSWGPNLLIKDGGAKLVQEWSDVTNELPPAVRRDLVRNAQQKSLLESNDEPMDTADGAEQSDDDAPVKALGRKLLNKLQVDTPQQLESIIESFEGVSSSELISALFDLEMSGLVRQLPGKQFVKVW
jgi:DNA processing protein